jgi:hypothetical protein
MRLPDAVYETVKRVAARYPGKRPHTDFALILNEVAWTHRLEGFGLSEKLEGINVEHPQLGWIAEDILQLPDGTHWDVFLSAGDNRPVIPNQGESIVPNTSRRWVKPVAPGGEIIIPPKPPSPPPVVVPPPPPTCTVVCQAEKADFQAIYDLIAKVVIDEHIGAIYQRLERIEQLILNLPR